MKRIFLLILSLTMVAALSTGVFAAQPGEDFTIDIGDLDLANQGYLRVCADTPYGFSGSVMVELEDAKGSETTLEIRWKDHWTAGCWLPEGPCTIRNAYVLDSSDFRVEADSNSCTISGSEDAQLHVTVLDDSESGTAEPSVSSDTDPLVTEPAASVSPEPPSGSTAVTEASAPAEPEESGQPFVSEVHASMLLLSAVSILVLVSVTRRKKEK